MTRATYQPEPAGEEPQDVGSVVQLDVPVGTAVRAYDRRADGELVQAHAYVVVGLFFYQAAESTWLEAVDIWGYVHRIERGVNELLWPQVRLT